MYVYIYGDVWYIWWMRCCLRTSSLKLPIVEAWRPWLFGDRYSVYLLYWYKSTNTDTSRAWKSSRRLRQELPRRSRRKSKEEKRSSSRTADIRHSYGRQWQSRQKREWPQHRQLLSHPQAIARESRHDGQRFLFNIVRKNGPDQRADAQDEERAAI